MREAQALQHLTDAVRATFDDDVADSIIGDCEMFAAAARLVRPMTPHDLDQAVRAIFMEIDDGFADWLAGVADSPAGWLYSRLSAHL
jgi:hypothetical protein